METETTVTTVTEKHPPCEECPDTCFNTNCEMFSKDADRGCTREWLDEYIPLGAVCEDFVGMTDASDSIPEASEAVNTDLPTSKPFEFSLPVFLTDVELGCYSKLQAELWTEWGRLNQAKKDSAAVYKKKIDDVESQLDEITRIVEEGSEERPVMCLWMYDYPQNEKILVRLDFNEIVERKTLTKEEIERYQNPELFGSETGDQAIEAGDVLPDSSSASEGAKMKAESIVSLSGSSTLGEESLKTSRDMDEDKWPAPPVQKECCLPKDRRFHRDGDIRIMYCTICQRVILKVDMSVAPPQRLPVEDGELFEGEIA